MNAVTSFQHLDDIEIPDIEIAEGWPVSDILTLDDCDDAFAYLTAAIATIELQIDSEGFKPLAMQRGEWVARAKAALRYKRGALAIVNTKRSRINTATNIATASTAERAMLEFIKSCVPAKQWLEWVTAANAPSPSHGREGTE